MKKCVLCSQLNANDAEICSRCQNPEFEPVDACPKCSLPKEDNSDFCSNCGYMYPPKRVAGLKAKYCPTCNAEVSALSPNCPVCGSLVGSANGNVQLVKKIVCPVCGKLNDCESQYCIYCFFDISGTPAKDMQVITEIKRVNGVPFSQRSLVSEYGIEPQTVCAKCDALNPIDEKYCVKCGNTLKIETKVQYCPSCGEENPHDAIFCMNCQHSFVRNGM